jgi:NDP-sugar pyrophosphorylase family protein
MKFFVLAGGYGERARPLSLVKPKPAFPLHGTPLIKLLLDQLKEKGFNQGFINLHHKPEAIRESIGDTPGLSINYLYEDELSGSKILTQAVTDTDEFLLVMNGDIFLEVLKVPIEKMLYELKETNCDGALLLRKNNDPAYSSVLTEKGFLQGTEENNGKESFMYTGVALFRKKVIEKIDDISFFNTLAKYRFKIKTFVYKDIWLDIGSPRLYFDANAVYKNHLRKNNDLNSLSENITISDDSRVSNCIVWENTKITAGSILSNCIVTSNLILKGVNYKDRIVYAKDENFASGGQGALLKNRPLDPHKTFV